MKGERRSVSQSQVYGVTMNGRNSKINNNFIEEALFNMD